MAKTLFTVKTFRRLANINLRDHEIRPVKYLPGVCRGEAAETLTSPDPATPSPDTLRTKSSEHNDGNQGQGEGGDNLPC